MGFAYAAGSQGSTDHTPGTWPSGWTWPDGPGGQTPPWPVDANGAPTYTFPSGNDGGTDWDTDIPLPPGYDWAVFPTYSGG